MDPITLILIIVILGCGGAAIFFRDPRLAGAGLVAVAIAMILGARG